MRNLIYLILTTSAVFLLIAKAQANDSGNFIKTVSIANKFEIDSSKLALERSQNDDVKQFARQMITDHTGAAGKLEETVKSSSDLNSDHIQRDLDTKHQSMIEELRNLDQEGFDNKYIEMQKTAHEKAITLFEDYSKNGDNKNLKNFATNTLPTLRAHLTHVQQLIDK